ncbi:PREDICTED: somatomedin-B and thrombospondin type-1 domain-containing protein-like [Priapulus caudatus]|uniref:Somatomedin-B and thrombospondin type-1 domain-containing protein-like n=1 Tax=Priapulus caudatus TaxID=37621 RepID=A0ABM1ESP8_PRICU|nr:PREDICTED: somatomedin-B and thrombospondin type-1 domain-containing protein-like [Priapulus caudatus]
MLLRIVLASLAASLCCVAPADAGCGDAGLCCPGRNADCVVQSYPLNFVPEDPVDEDRCYCDEHCVKLEDCCDDYHSACRAKNCLVGNFTAWSPCSTRCGVGIMTRSRDILQAASNGGEQCPHMEEKRGCMGFECSQNDSAAIKEVGLLLPLKYGKARDYNPDDDINKNIKEHYHKSYRRNEGQTR